MKYFSMFSGIGGFELGIDNAWEYLSKERAERSSVLCGGNSTSFESRDNKQPETWGNREFQQPENIGYSEIDKYAVQIYEKHFGSSFDGKQNRGSEEDTQGVNEERKGLESTESQMSNPTERQSSEHLNNNGERPKQINPNKGHKNYGNCREINRNTVADFDMLVGGFPCQAFSIAGKRGGFEDTRGTLFFEIARCLKEKRPRLCVLENVKGLLSHDKGATFVTIISTLDELGYDLQWQVLNSKNFGVPQNRERVFIIGHLRGTSRPEVFPITGTDSKDIIVNGVLDTETWRKRHEQIRRTHDIEGISPTLPTGTGGGVMTKIMNNAKVRRLTPTECERLQGFPDGWTEGVSDTQRYKCLGNAVTTNVITAIMEKLL